MRVIPLDIKEVEPGFVAAPVELKLAPANDGTITGYGSVFGVRDRHGDVVEKSAFAASLRGHLMGKTAPAMLWSHDPSRPIGVWDTFVEDGRGLKLSGRLNLDTVDGAEALALLKQGAISGLSIGYQVMPGGAAIDKQGVRRLTKLELWEVSLVTFPSNSEARISGVKSMDNRGAFEAFLRKSGFAKAAARRLAGGGWPALQNDDDDTAGLIAAVKTATKELEKKG